MSLASSVAYRVANRAKWASLGVFFVRRLNLRVVRIHGRRIVLSFPDAERGGQTREFCEIVVHDCYRLSQVRHPVSTVLDVGANIGLFALAARRHFPKARIHCYEPNPSLTPYLKAHCDAVDAVRHMEAVGSQTGTVALNIRWNSSRHATTHPARDGTIPQVSFADAIARLNVVDLLKLDCEGAEWDLFTQKRDWANVRSVVMEYHLWAKEGSTVRTVEDNLRGLGFSSVSVLPNPPDNPWGFAFASKD